MFIFGGSNPNNNNNNCNNDDAMDLINVISVMLGYENLMENRQQSAQNDVAKHNQRQVKQILDDLHKQFDVQNEILKYQTSLLEEILNILKGEN